MISADQPISLLPGVGPKTSKKLAKIGINTLSDLLRHYPTRYLDLTTQLSINKLQEKTFSSFKAQINNPKQFRSHSGKLITQATAYDQTGQITLTWFNSPYIQNILKTNITYLIAGKPSFFGKNLTIVAPQIETAFQNTLHTTGLVPIYPLTEGITSKYLRRLIDRCIKITSINDPIPKNIIKKLNLPDLKSAIKSIHFPDNQTSLLNSDKRLSFNEHLAINLKNNIESMNFGEAPSIITDPKLDKKIRQKLPFKLTNDQKEVLSKLYHTISQKSPGHTLVQGDTGSGKTILALFCAIHTTNNQHSFCLLAPTQILAEQHYQTFAKYLGKPKNLILVTGKSPLKSSPRKPAIFIGTHAILNQIPKTLTCPLGCVFIDEQHKFGVKQRDFLKKTRPQPHLVNLTATPIPRTLALGIFGDINILTIKHRPKSRLPVKTWIISNKRFQNSHTWLSQHLKNNNKIFIICPYIEESKINSTIKSAINTFDYYKKQFGHLTKVNLIHGQLKSDLKTKILDQFQSPISNILVSTPIIEVGIDIPSANIIIIHSAERFGLAQLHQLRGRVGRGLTQSYCLLVPSDDNQINLERLQLLTKYHNGLTLAKLDLKLRGVGEIAGLKQHGNFSVRLKHFWNKSLYQIAKKTSKELLQQNPQEAKIIADKLTCC